MTKGATFSIILNDVEFEVSSETSNSTIICCDKINSIEINVDEIDVIEKSFSFSLPSVKTKIKQLSMNDIFSRKVRTGLNMGDVIVEEIKNRLLSHYLYFFINPVGVETEGLEKIIDFIKESTNRDNAPYFCIFISHLDFHRMFEDDSIRVVPFDANLKHKEKFKIIPAPKKH